MSPRRQTPSTFPRSTSPLQSLRRRLRSTTGLHMSKRLPLWEELRRSKRLCFGAAGREAQRRAPERERASHWNHVEVDNNGERWRIAWCEAWHMNSHDGSLWPCDSCHRDELRHDN
mmetsp:Transcript_31159/g.78855  ORF Transcript_31159/g.78855 Transcript_31159/m.78855 type:complete len:116 (+) Transcript_31159:214-561(+)